MYAMLFSFSIEIHPPPHVLFLHVLRIVMQVGKTRIAPKHRHCNAAWHCGSNN